MQEQVSPWVGYLFNGSQMLFLGAAVVVGARLMNLYRRTRQLPELLLGVSFFFGSGIGFVVLVTGMIQLAEKSGDRALAVGLISAGWLLLSIGTTALLGFTYHVYRKGVQWARVYAALVFALLWGGYLGRALTGHFSQEQQFQGFWYVVHQGAIVLEGLWALSEALRYYGLMKKRLAIGLADPIVTNRFLLWGTASALGCVMIMLGISPAFYPLLDPAAIGLVSTVTLIAMAMIGAIIVGLYWLTFFPPRLYRAFVVRSGATATATA